MNPTPVDQLWRPGDRMTYGEAAWLGAALGVAFHAMLSFFELWFPGLRAVLVVFVPAERIAYGLAAGGSPYQRWVLLLLSLGTFGALACVALAAASREGAAIVRAALARRRLARAPLPHS